MKSTAALTTSWGYFILVTYLANRVELSITSQIPKHNLHELLTSSRDQLVQLFNSDNINTVPEYEVVQFLSHRTSRTTHHHARHVRFNAFNRNFDLSLQPKDDIVSPQLLLMRRTVSDGWTKQIYSPQGEFLQGHVTDDPLSHVALREHADGEMSGAIISGAHEYRIEPVPRHVRTTMSLEGPTHHVISRRNLKSRTYPRPVTAKIEEPLNIVKRNSRRTRRSLGPKVIEAMMTLDKPSVDYYGNGSMDYVLAVANMVSRLYADASIGFECSFTLTKVILIETNMPELDITKNAIDSASKYLRVFSSWYQKVNPPVGSVGHFDNGVLLTRDICGLKSCQLDGLAYYAIPCSALFGASVNDAHGISTAFSVAHEMAHNFGVDHDSGACSNGYIMSAGQATGANAFKWSQCSKDVLMEQFSKVTCYDNKPPQHITLPSLPPGYSFDGDKQCKFLYGSSYSLCPLTSENCGTLFCIRGSVCISSRGGPPVDGTTCGKRKWCISGHCVEVGSSLPPPVDGGWGAWGEYSSCSRTCGGGVKYKTRKCDNPSPQFGGKSCPGSAFGEWMICNSQKCPSGSEDYRVIQCKAKSSKYDTYYIKGSRCVLWCRTGSSATREGYVADGTKYDDSDTDIRDICIEGERVAVGCDDVIGSGNVMDRCRKCKGDGSTCVLKQFEFTEDYRGYGPPNAKQMTVLPVGTTNCDITENKATDNLVNLKIVPSDKNPFIFPERPLTSTREAAGTVVEYYIGDALYYAERMHIRGPTNKELAPMFVYLSYTNVGYTIKYYVPGQATQTAFFWKKTFVGNCSKHCAGGYRQQVATCHRGDDESQVSGNFCDAGTKPLVMSKCNEQPCIASWVPEPWDLCSQRCSGGNMTRLVPCMQRVTQEIVRGVEFRYCAGQQRPPLRSVCNVVDCDPEWVVGKWSRCRGALGSPGIAEREVTCHRRLANGSFPLVDTEACEGVSTRTYETSINCTVTSGGMPIIKMSAFSSWCSTLLISFITFSN